MLTKTTQTENFIRLCDYYGKIYEETAKDLKALDIQEINNIINRIEDKDYSTKRQKFLNTYLHIVKRFRQLTKINDVKNYI